MNNNGSLYCDTSTGTIRPYVPKSLRKEIFDVIHGLSHPSGRTTSKLIKQKFVWPGMRKDIVNWARTCVACQRAKIQRHTRNSPQTFDTPDNRFDHVHLDLVGPLPSSKGSKGSKGISPYYDRPFLTLAGGDPLTDITADTVASAFYTHWVARFGAPRTITTDQGSQFEAALFKALSNLVGTNRTRSSPYHPAANGLVERWHRSLKAALMCHGSTAWVELLPTVLLGLRTCYKEDIKASAAELVYGTLRVPGEFFSSDEMLGNPPIFVEKFRENMRRLRATPTAHHHKRSMFVHNDLYTCSHVFLREDAVRRALQPPYSRPFPIVERINDQLLKINVNGREINISTERLKPAYTHNVEAETSLNKRMLVLHQVFKNR